MKKKKSNFFLSKLCRLVDPSLLMENGILRRLIDTFWPGPLTILMPKSELVADNCTAGQEKVMLKQ